MTFLTHIRVNSTNLTRCFYFSRHSICTLLPRGTNLQQSTAKVRLYHYNFRQFSSEKKSLKSEKSCSQNEEKGTQNNGDDSLLWKIIGSVLLLDLLFITFYRDRLGPGGVTKKLGWSDFVNEVLPSGQVTKIVYHPDKRRVNDKALVHVKYGAKTGDMVNNVYSISIPSFASLEKEVSMANQLLPPSQWNIIQYTRPDPTLARWLTCFLIVTVCILSFCLTRNGKSSDVKRKMTDALKSDFKIINPRGNQDASKESKTMFKDISGCHEAKVEMKEIVDYLNDPKKFTNLGARLPRGALLKGPPGCGKTLLARALATEANVPFIATNGPEFVEIVGGLGASRVRNLFDLARSISPCIIYIDEIDAIGKRRNEGYGASGESEQTLNQLLVEMDGLEGKGRGLIVIGSTNRPDSLDKALLRPGRFDRHVSIDLPTSLEREEIFQYYIKKIHHDPSILEEVRRLAQMTPGFSGADIGNVVNEAAIRTASRLQSTVTATELEEALEIIVADPVKRNGGLVGEEREVVAYHEAGHALVSWVQNDGHRPMKVSILPRSSSGLGWTQYTPNDRRLQSKEEMFTLMCVLLGGRSAENVRFGRISTAAHEDLHRATKMASDQVKVYGMSAVVGPLSFSHENQFASKPYSGKFSAVMDREISSLVFRAHSVSEKIIRDNKEKLDQIAHALLDREILTCEDLRKLVGDSGCDRKNK